MHDREYILEVKKKQDKRKEIIIIINLLVATASDGPVYSAKSCLRKSQ